MCRINISKFKKENFVLDREESRRGKGRERVKAKNPEIQNAHVCVTDL